MSDNKGGRPTIYTKELADEICQLLSEGKSLRQICKLNHMPERHTVARWAVEDREGFYSQYTRARDIGLDAMSDEIIEIADDGSNDWMKTIDEEGQVAYRLNGEHVQRSKLRFDARRWYLSKMAPKKYGDSTLLKHSNDPENPLPLINNVTMTKEDAAAIYLAAVNRAKPDDK